MSYYEFFYIKFSHFRDHKFKTIVVSDRHNWGLFKGGETRSQRNGSLSLLGSKTEDLSNNTTSNLLYYVYYTNLSRTLYHKRILYRHIQVISQVIFPDPKSFDHSPTFFSDALSDDTYKPINIGILFIDDTGIQKFGTLDGSVVRRSEVRTGERSKVHQGLDTTTEVKPEVK